MVEREKVYSSSQPVPPCFPPGRIACSQVSALSAIPLTAVLLFAVPRSPAWWPLHALTLGLNGFLVSWNGPATNNPIFAEIVEPKLRTAVYAFDRSLVRLESRLL